MSSKQHREVAGMRCLFRSRTSNTYCAQAYYSSASNQNFHVMQASFDRLINYLVDSTL